MENKSKGIFDTKDVILGRRFLWAEHIIHP